MLKSPHFLFLGLLALLIACAGTPTTHFYLLESLSTGANLIPKAPGEISLAIEPVAADRPYSDDRLIFRDSVFEIQFYHYHRWVKPPEMMITDKLVAGLRASQLFKNVAQAPSLFPADFVLKGELLALEEWDEGANWFGRVRLGFVLVDWRSREIVWQQEFSRQIPVAAHEPVAVVQALNTGIDQCLQDLVVALKPFLK